MATKLVVFGGNGFLGRRICQAGIERGFKVTSLSRSGKPPQNIQNADFSWISKVEWKPANIFKPETYQDDLKDSDNVVHSIGILLENENYKKSINSNSTILNEFTNFLKPSNPMTKSAFNSYEAINRDSAVLLAETLREQFNGRSKPAFIYISADRGFPGIPRGYINSKREAEKEIQLLEDIRPIVIRPGFMFDESSNDDNMRSAIKTFVDLMNLGNNSILGNKIGLLNELIRPTVSTQKVAETIIRKIDDPSFEGVVKLEDIQ